MNEIIEKLEYRLMNGGELELSSCEIKVLLDFIYANSINIQDDTETLENGDLLTLRNGNIVVYDENKEWLIRRYYDNDLKCPTDSQFDIVGVQKVTSKVAKI